VIRGFYLADSEDTLWAEWYRHTAELNVPPATRLPRDVWRIAVDVADIGDLSDTATLRQHGVDELLPTRKQWPATQPVGELYHHDHYRGILTPSAAHVGGQVLTIFRPTEDMPGLRTVPPARAHHELPPLPTGLRT
jgi:RES domain-containing protein